jgi:predicted permease
LAIRSNLWSDFRYAARRLGLSPGFTTAAIATIALGVGVNTGIFSVLNSLALRELPAPDADELVSIHQTIDGAGIFRPMRGAREMFSTSEFRAYLEGTQTLSGILGFSAWETVTLGTVSPRRIEGALVTCNYFDVLRQPPAFGPGFTAESCEAGDAAPTVVLGHDLWTTAFNADPGVIGRPVLLNRQAFTVVGVAPEGVHGVDVRRVAFFAPISTQALLIPGVNVYREESSWLTLVGRKANGATLDQVRAELGLIAARIDQQQAPRRTTIVVDRASPVSSPEDRKALFDVGSVVMTVFGLVLLMACANVANLVLARAAGRTREIAVRLSLGATRARIVQQLLAENILIAVAGGTLGALLAMWSSQSLVVILLSALSPDTSTVAIDATPDLRVFAFAFALTIASAVLFGVAPALQASRSDLHAATKGDATGLPNRGPRSTLLIVQVGMCMVLMISAGLLLRGLHAAQTVEPGFVYENIAVAEFDLSGAGYDAASATAFQSELLGRVATLPGVAAVAQSSTTPLRPGRNQMIVRIPGDEQARMFHVNSVSPDYFSLIGVPIVHGRTFTDSELADGSRALIVTEETARRAWPGRDPIGQTLIADLGRYGAIEFSVVGVAKDAQLTSVGEIDTAYVYTPAVPVVQPTLRLLAKSHLDFDATAAGITKAAADLDPALVVQVTPLRANLDFWQRLAGLLGSLSMSLGILALALAGVGVYGVVAYTVGRRAREIGIRIALGASGRDVLSVVLRRALSPVVVGAVIGVAIAIGFSWVLSSVLFGVSPVDPLALVGATVFVLAIAFAAAALAARPAIQLDPMVALRDE